MIRFAVVGTNWITKQFVDAAHETGKYKLTAIYSRSLEQAQAFAKDYPVEHLFTSLDELAQSPDVDAVYIASPNSLHFPQTRLFLSHKKHVICEKPLASNLQEVEAAMHSALDMVRRTNPMETPAGQRQAGTLMVSWTSVPIEALRPNVDQSGWPGFYTVGLYEATVRVLRDGEELQVFRVRQIGWKQVRAGGES